MAEYLNVQIFTRTAVALIGYPRMCHSRPIKYFVSLGRTAAIMKLSKGCRERSRELLRLIGRSSKQRPDLKFPLSAGQQWTYEYELRLGNNPRSQKRSAEITVAGMEQVTTPAGTFKAYKLTRIESWLAMGRRSPRGQFAIARRLTFTVRNQEHR